MGSHPLHAQIFRWICCDRKGLAPQNRRGPDEPMSIFGRSENRAHHSGRNAKCSFRRCLPKPISLGHAANVSSAVFENPKSIARVEELFTIRRSFCREQLLRPDYSELVALSLPIRFCPPSPRERHIKRPSACAVRLKNRPKDPIFVIRMGPIIITAARAWPYDPVALGAQFHHPQGFF